MSGIRQGLFDLRECSTCGAPALGFFWSKDQGYVGWCKEHVNAQRIEVNEESFRE